MKNNGHTTARITEMRNRLDELLLIASEEQKIEVAIIAAELKTQHAQSHYVNLLHANLSRRISVFELKK